MDMSPLIVPYVIINDAFCIPDDGRFLYFLMTDFDLLFSLTSMRYLRKYTSTLIIIPCLRHTLMTTNIISIKRKHSSEILLFETFF